ncbi:hypothetical protein DES53_10476 [Roseimicrobium gellanilyticum]|uniref:Uncharacterized protein n=1 Tax=Roseimicrobium gellanilyticum TaxID=748857 RepID=A0A366HM96_9BACT|nr:hypothetical protein [Roseimicrobium gellanilyticum]RBP44257.1 hypothetical protein DES53_10476 [Roseimicrobium gellanilyticum]
MALDVDKLREGLDHYRTTLGHQRNDLHTEVQEINRSFHALFGAYGGRMAEDLQRHWSDTARWFEEYLDKSTHLDHFLQERIEELRHL